MVWIKKNDCLPREVPRYEVVGGQRRDDGNYVTLRDGSEWKLLTDGEAHRELEEHKIRAKVTREWIEGLKRDEDEAARQMFKEGMREAFPEDEGELPYGVRKLAGWNKDQS